MFEYHKLYAYNFTENKGKLTFLLITDFQLGGYIFPHELIVAGYRRSTKLQPALEI